jgi:hypothetical protein
MSVGKSVRLFLVDGTPGGLMTAEIMNWTGHVIAASRSDLGALLKRPEVSRTGIYILLGEDPQNALEPMAYIGEADVIKDRLYQHARPEAQHGKDFWNRAIALTSKDQNLTKAHARYLESRFISMAAAAKRSRLANGTNPEFTLLPEADISDMDYFVSQAEIVLPLLGVNIFRKPKTITQTATPQPAEEYLTPGDEPLVFEMVLKKYNVVARAQEVDGEFIVLAGSGARLGWAGVELGYGRLKSELESNGIIVVGPDGKSGVFTSDHAFSSPSAAAAVVAGHATNGRTAWKAEGGGLTYGAWQEKSLTEA